MKNKKMYYVVIICLITLDQIVKQLIFINLYNSNYAIIKNVLNITYVENTGGAYGVGDNNIWFFIISNMLIIFTIIALIIIKKEKLKSTEIFSLSLILSGGISNFADRIFRGYVVDYIDITPLIKYPVFNLADLCIVIGVLLILISTFKKMGEKAK